MARVFDLNVWRRRRRSLVTDDVGLVADQLAAIERYLALPLEQQTFENGVIVGAEEQAALLRVVLGLAAGRAA